MNKTVQLSGLEKQSIAELTRLFRERFKAAEVVLYGSAARGEMDTASDIDLFVVLPSVDWQIEKEIIALCFEAELRCGRVFSAVCFSVDELQNGPMGESPLVRTVRKEGQRL